MCQVVLNKKISRCWRLNKIPLRVTEVNHIWLLMIIKRSFGLALPFPSNRLPFPTSVSLLSPPTPPSLPSAHPPPGPFTTSWFFCFGFPLPHLNSIQRPGRWQQCYVMLHQSSDICLLLLLCSPLCTIHTLNRAGFLSLWPDSSPWQGWKQWRIVSLSSSRCKHTL